VKKIFISIIATVALAQAEGMESFLDDAIVQMDAPQQIETSTSTILYGGRFRTKTPSYQFQPFHATAPSIKAGCNGIDIGFGGFEFLNADQIVKFGKAVMANSEGLIFSLGLKAVCPACDETLKAFNKLVQGINSMNFDSCQAAKALTGVIGDVTGINQQSGSSGPGWMTSMNETINRGADWINDNVNSLLKDSGCDPSQKTCGARFFTATDASTNSYMKYISENYNSSSIFTADEYDIMKSFTGDMIVSRAGANGSDKTGKINFRTPTTGRNIEKEILYLIGAPGGELMKYDDDGSIFLDKRDVETGLIKKIKENITSIENAIKNRTALSKNDLKFLNSFNMPLYQIFNKLSTVPGGSALITPIKGKLAEVMAHEIIFSYFSRMRIDLVRAKNSLNPSLVSKLPYAPEDTQQIQPHIRAMLEGIDNMTGLIYVDFAKKTAELSDKIASDTALLNKLNQMEQLTMMRTNPKFFDNFMFAKALGK
jgi:conjugative transfer pilus assembly protein TraH